MTLKGHIVISINLCDPLGRSEAVFSLEYGRKQFMNFASAIIRKEKLQRR
jgi:hypothetical protein